MKKLQHIPSTYTNKEILEKTKVLSEFAQFLSEKHRISEFVSICMISSQIFVKTHEAIDKLMRDEEVDNFCQEDIMYEFAKKEGFPKYDEVKKATFLLMEVLGKFE